MPTVEILAWVTALAAPLAIYFALKQGREGPRRRERRQAGIAFAVMLTVLAVVQLFDKNPTVHIVEAVLSVMLAVVAVRYMLVLRAAKADSGLS